ncbi:GPP34 family phosphoprotein [Dactylosporangium sp. NPDC051485]|uniref:GOLPH3/VPS74 family protein n=1 Tax=Dactylosporangium sp. NPDC051485 TaxID=3154846 RepID=UPI00344379BA
MTAPRRLPLADEFWLLAHHDYSGRPLCAAPILGAGLASCVLAELWMAGLLNVAQGRVVVVPRPSPPNDPVWQSTLRELAAQPVSYPLREWISHLARSASSGVTTRLIDANLVEEVRGGPFGRRKYVPSDPAVGSSPAIMLNHMIENAERLDYQTAVLAGHVLIAGLDSEIVSPDPAATRNGLRSMVRDLPPDLLSVLSALQSVVSAAPLRVNR